MTDFTQFPQDVVSAALASLEPKLYVYEVKEYEEYAAQVDRGLFATPERAIEEARKVILNQYKFRNHPDVPPISVLLYDDGQDGKHWLVLTGDWTVESFKAWQDSDADSFYWWYSPPFNHVGVVSVFQTEVQR